MSAAASRALLRRQPLQLQLRQQFRRTYADSTTEKAKETAANVTSKASEGLSKVTSSAGPAISKAASSVGNAVNKTGGRVGRLINSIQGLVPPTVYYSKVGFELSKLVFRGQRMSPPTAAQFQSYFSPLIQRLRNPSALLQQAANSTSNAAQSAAQSAAQMTPESAIQRLRSFDRTTLVQGGVIFAEVLGFFTVGEIIGRMKIIGYRGEVHHEH